jgi:hypothetical protein
LKTQGDRLYGSENRERDTGLSGDHFEHFNPLKGDNYKLLLAVIGERLKVSKNGRLVQLKCGDVTEAINYLSFDKPDGHSSHTFLKGLDKDDMAPELLIGLISDIKMVSSI